MSKNPGTRLVFICLVIIVVFWLTSMATPGWSQITIHSSYTNVSVFAIKQYVLLVIFYNEMLFL